MTEMTSGWNGLVQIMYRALHFSLRRLDSRTATIVVSSLIVSVVVCPVTHAAVGCENEALRSTLGSAALPDCRAYEMVTPPYKEGYPLFLEDFASNGDTVFVYGYANLAGTPGVGESREELYLDTRTSTGWHLTPMNTALTEFVGQLPLAFEANSGETLWSQHTPSQPAQVRTLYIRSAAGAFSDVGPLNPNPVVASGGSDVIEAQSNNYTAPTGATPNYEHIVLRAPNPEDYWEFDPTKGAGGSLYEYSGIDNEHPVLVGVTGAKGSDALLGECGSALGSGGSGSMYNALSASGEVIFFTVEPMHYTGCSASAPESAEVYARLHGSRISSEEAETVDVSETECTEVCGGESGKEFEGASESGEKVFFTSTQKLTNDASDLTAGGNAASDSCAEEEGASKGCNLYLYDFARPPHERLTLVAGGASEVLGVAGMAEDGVRIYFVAKGKPIAGVGNEFGKLPLEGSPNLYVYDTDTGKTAFITTLGAQDREDWRSAFNHPVEVTGEGGRFVLFASSAQGVTPDDTGGPGLEQLFEYNAEGETGDPEVGELVRVTQGEDGYAENGNSVSEGINLHSVANIAHTLGQGSDFKSSTNRLNVSVDGKTVVFETAGALSPRALPASAEGCQSVYEFRSAGPIADGVVSLLSDGRDVQSNKGASCGAELERSVMDASGDSVLFSSADELVSVDTDGFQRDVYDARVEGGFAPGPAGGELGLCLGGSCEGAVSGGGGLPGPGSAAPAEGNIGVGSASVQAKPKPKPKPKAKVKPRRKAKTKSKRKARAGRGKGVRFVRVGG